MDGYSFHPIGADGGLLSDATGPDARRLAVVDSGAGPGFLKWCGCLLGRTGCRADPIPNGQSHLLIHTDAERATNPDNDCIAGTHSHPSTFCYGELDLRSFGNGFHNTIFDCDPRYEPARDLGDPDRTTEHVHRFPLFHAYRLAHSHSNVDEDPHQSAPTYMDALADVDTASNPYTNIDTHADADSHPNTDLHSYIHSDAHIDADPNANTLKVLLNICML